MNFLHAWCTAADPRPARLPAKNIALAWFGGFLATAAFAGTGDAANLPLVLGSFGASCLLVFAYPASPFSQPRNVVGGHFTATLTGLIVMALFGVHWWSMAIGVGTAVALMLLLRVPHPPAGSNPLIVMLGGVGWDFLFTPTLFGSLILVAVALFYNNRGGKERRYPLYW
ncbi:HPP family protein [Neisseria chenwenguii]|uniref:HPP family protein n=1 Tax=Neisseria chenwenguii TaxID=1853278 RepID=A0A220S3B7_9NEIS|nr:HPP family protein [Neisseria chenwenguii]ASK27999.1 HPP family protein [Neisseria chenwenguii]ROV54468.1 HPP family protein [Neisseria chenwenguii]